MRTLLAVLIGSMLWSGARAAPEQRSGAAAPPNMSACRAALKLPEQAARRPQSGESDAADREKARGWAEQKVILLADARFPEQIGSNGYYVFPKGRQGTPVPASYAGRQGAIVAGSDPAIKVGADEAILVKLDDSGEEIVFRQAGDLLFIGDLDAAKAFVNRVFWTKGRIRLHAPGSDPNQDFDKQKATELPPGTRISISAAEPGVAFNPIAFRVTSEAGQGRLFVRGVDPRFHLMSTHGESQLVWSPAESFIDSAPLTLCPAWSADAMKLVRAGQPVVGMSAEMVSLACGVRASVEGVQLGGDGKVATIYRCAGTDFTIRNGRVAEILRR